ncbi:uncharacterized protein MEPE_04585 [Melanopsichium pennsylvanicum]|uniref:Uncharacterized protein n=1 Tax=Melanopsichium pennsylvanicum TaxID=63383 RepID=A0AAJ5C6I6_9BASI|nr:uncharacterized protein MEPE_04585 [Melanopsichium pennsylvanicum]
MFYSFNVWAPFQQWTPFLLTTIPQPQVLKCPLFLNTVTTARSTVPRRHQQSAMYESMYNPRHYDARLLWMVGFMATTLWCLELMQNTRQVGHS